jgi:O-antigen/teichoic acid export membrane protein
MSLSEQATSGVKWSTASQVGRQATQLFTVVILTRLLSPADFGLVSMALVVTGFVTIFKDMGTSAAVIQRKNLSEEFLCSIYWVNVSFGFLVMVILLVISPWVASFYHEPRVTLLLKVLSCTFLISGLSILHQAILERNLEFNKLAKLEIGSMAFGSVVGIGSAALGYGVWSLVYQVLAWTVMTTLLLWIACRWRPKLTFHWVEIKQVSNYSLNLTGFSIFNYWERNADYLLIGRFLGAQELGYYTLAYRLMLYPLQSVSWVVSRVMFPAFSKVQSDNVRFSRAYLRVASLIALVTFPVIFGLIATIEPFILTFLGSQWAPVVILLLILGPVGLIQSIVTTTGVIYQAKGRTDWMLRWGVVSGLLLIGSFVIGLHWGIVGVAAAYAVATAILVYPEFAIPFRLIDLRVRNLAAVLWKPFLSSLVMLLGLLGLKAALPAYVSGGWSLGILVPAGIGVYLLATWIVNRDQLRQALALVRGRL